MKILHDSRNLTYRSPFGAVKTGSEVILSADVVGVDVSEAVLQIRRDEESEFTSVPMVETCQPVCQLVPEEKWQDQSLAGTEQNHGGVEQSPAMRRFTVTINTPEGSCLLWYRFRFKVSDENGIHSVYYCNNKEGLGGEGQIIDTDKEGLGGEGQVAEKDEKLIPYQITVYRRSETPDWYKNGIVYQIFPDRFARDDDWRGRCEQANRRVNERRIDMQRVIEDDWYRPAYYVRDSAKRVVKWPIYGGSLRGIQSKLDYLRSLGVTVIYLNPIFEASTNHRYDTGNYMKIDPALGTEQDFMDLAKAARDRGIRLILDGVFSHTGSDSIYFDKYGNYPSTDEASSSAAAKAESTPNKIKGAWHNEDSPFRSWYKFDPAEKWGYKSWWGVEDLPEVIEEDHGYQKYILGSEAAGGSYEGVVPHWLRLGASGWRLDVADELPDSFIKGVRRAIRGTDPDGLLIGEVWEDASNKISYGERRQYFAGDELDGTMNYPLRDILLDYINYTITSGQAADRFMSLAENYPRENLYGALNLIGSHDRKRIITMMAADQDVGAAISKVKLLSTLEYALPGVPCIYYGDEAGLQGSADPENRSGFPWGRENSELQFHYRMLGLIYSEHPVLKDGDLTMLSCGSTSAEHAGGISEDVLAFVRSYPKKLKGGQGESGSADKDAVSTDERILVLVNRSYGKSEVDLSSIASVRCGYAIDLLTSEELKTGAACSRTSDGLETETSRSLSPLIMDPLSVKLILLKDEPPVKEDLGRSAGVICDVRSLGEQPLGKKARDFVDYIASAGFGIWQVLPVNPSGLGGSPYDSVSAFAGDPGMIDHDEVPDDSGYDRFCSENAWWLHSYAAYCAIKEKLGGKALLEWSDEYRLADPEEVFHNAEKESPELISRIMHEQYWFAAEWNVLKEYANDRGVRMMGDIPMYMSADSADVWADMSEDTGSAGCVRISEDTGSAGHVFRIDKDGRLSVHSGVPPDYFSKDGQDWGNPLYDWDELKAEGYGWWLRRIRQCAARFDVLRIDHFRALSEYYAIPEGGKPSEGLWQQGPGSDFIRSIKVMLAEEGLGMKLLAEDLGSLDAGVYDLLKLSGLPGMDIWQFSAYEMMAQPPEIAKQRAFYTGTHDNSTLAGFVEEHAEEIIGHAVEQIEDEKEAIEAAAKDIIRKIYVCPAVLAMVQLQDVFMLGNDARMNVPGISEGNWKWRIPGGTIKASFADEDSRAAWFRELAEETGRL